MRTRKHHIISRISNDYEIYFIEPYRKGHKINLGKIIDGVTIITVPSFKLGNKYINFLFNINFLRIIFHSFQKLYLKLLLIQFSNIKIKLQIISNPFFITATNKKSPIIWDFNDDPFQFPEMPKWIHLNFKKFLENDVIQIWASSKQLYEKLIKKYPNKIKYIPNGVELDKFKIVKNTRNDTFTIGYVGIISSWFFDFELVKLIAKSFPQANIRLIGPIDPLSKNLISIINTIPNISLEGKIDYNLIPKLMASFDVGIIPLIQSEKVYQLNSAKFLQYLASGIPIISVPFYEFNEFRDDVYFCKSNEEFLNSIRDIIKNDNKKQFDDKKLICWDWDQIAENFKLQINSNITNF